MSSSCKCVRKSSELFSASVVPYLRIPVAERSENLSTTCWTIGSLKPHTGAIIGKNFKVSGGGETTRGFKIVVLLTENR